MLDDLLVAFGVNATVIPKLWQKRLSGPNDDASLGATPQYLSIIHSTLDHYKRQLLPGEKLDNISEVLLRNIDASLCWESIYRRYGVETTRISLKDFCSEVLVDALSRTLFGHRIYEAAPDLVQNLLDFNDDAWMLIFHYPQSAESKLKKSRSKILEGFMNYIQGPEEIRSGRAWLIERVMEEQKAVDIRDEDRAALLLMIYWA